MTDSPLRAARASLERVEEAARDGVEIAKETAADSLDEARAFLEKQARERPLATIGVAAGVGVLLGVLLFGGRRD